MSGAARIRGTRRRQHVIYLYKNQKQPRVTPFSYANATDSNFVQFTKSYLNINA